MAETSADTHGAEATADAVHGAADAGAHGAHGGEAASFPPFDSSLFASQLIWFAITFGALYFIVSRYILPTVSGVLARRASAISSDLELAAQKSAAAEDARTTMERASAKARADARAMIEAARADVQAKLSAEQDAADRRLAAKIEAAETEVAAARAKAMAEAPGIAEALARDIADKFVPTNASAPRQRAAGEA
jgi:F-type H+-transporting ATPase subunit b